MISPIALVSNKVWLSSVHQNDVEAIMDCMKDREISENTLRIPYPYKEEDAKTWIEDNQIFEEENGFNKNFIIRNESGRMIGCIGIHFSDGLTSDKSEFGYWLGKKYWNQGIMTEVIKKLCQIAKERHQLKILTAHAFAHNLASHKVLLKAGFTQYELIKNMYEKNGKQIDAIKFMKEL